MAEEQQTGKQGNQASKTPDQSKKDESKKDEISQEELGRVSGGWSGSNENPTES